MNGENRPDDLEEIRQKANDLLDELVEIVADAQEKISGKSQDLFRALGGCKGQIPRYPKL
jgi:hypothetical protein